VKQLMAEVVRQQIQKEAVQEAYAHRMDAFKSATLFSNSSIGAENSTVTKLMPVRSNRLHPHNIPMLDLKLKKTFIQPEVPFENITDNRYYVQLHVGSCICRTHFLNPSPQGFLWDRLTVSGKVPVNDVQLDECIVEILDENPQTPAQALIGRGHFAIDNTLGFNMGRDTLFEVEIMTREKSIYGTLSVVLNADVEEFASGFVSDPRNLNYYEINRKKSSLKKIEMGLDATQSIESLDVHTAQTAANFEANSPLATLVGDLRGDGVDFIKLLTGDVTLDDVHRVGGAVSNRITQVRVSGSTFCFPLLLLLFHLICCFVHCYLY
jgi:hypothetical protein